MYKMLVYEHLTATASSSSPLFAEGKAMVEAVVADLRAIPNIEVTTWAKMASDPEKSMRQVARTVDAVLLIAPETAGVLYRLCRAVEEVGGRLLGPSSSAVLLTADKLALSRHFEAIGVPTPPAQLLPASDLRYPLVCKPRDGAGSQATFLVNSAEELTKCLQQARAEGHDGELITQPYVAGLSASVSFLAGSADVVPLVPTSQILSEDGRFHYLGSGAPLPAVLASRATALGRRAIDSIAGLGGYVGVDLVLGENAGDDQVIEINPRMTTSYLTIRRLIDRNAMETMLRLGSTRLRRPSSDDAFTARRPAV